MTFVALSSAFALMAEDEVAAAPEVVWVKADKAAFEAQGIIGDGTEANPFNTIQKGVDTVAVGGSVKIMAGTYDYDEQFDGTHTNRVIIAKRIILDGIGGIEDTHIVGKLSTGNNVGNGPDAIRCIKITEAGKESFIKNVTIRNGGAANDNSNYIRTWGGGVCGYSNSSRDKIYLVDCVISNCAAAMGGALQSVYAIRCKIDKCRSASWGVAARYACLYRCLITNCRNYASNNRPVVAYSYAVNCTLAKCSGPTQGFGRGSSIYNCIAWGCGAADIVEGESQYNVTAKENCYTDNDCSDPFVALANGDYRLAANAEVIGRGVTNHFSRIVLPEGVDAYVDLAGNKIDTSKEVCDIGCYQRIFDWYVDAEDGDDGNLGSVADSPMKTLAAIMPKTLSGDTVHAAAGTYDEGSMVAGSNPAKSSKARVAVPAGVSLVADEGAERTFIVGAPDATESGDEYGFGTNALRCVYLFPASGIEGFTVTGGYTWQTLPSGSGFDHNDHGGGIYSESDYGATVDKCIISNNWSSFYGGGVCYSTVVQSRLFENHALKQGGAMYKSRIYGCIVDKNYTGFKADTNPSACFWHQAIVGCTLGSGTYTHDNGTNGKVLTGENGSAVFRDSLVLGSLGNYGNASYPVVNCVFKNGVGSWGTVDKLQDCIVSAGDGIKLDENYRPLPGSAGVDRVTAEELTEATGGKLPTDKDLSGFQRMMNGKIDVGALEADWRGEYAKMLDGSGRRIAVTAATSGVTTNDIGGVSSLLLEDGDSFGLQWWSAMPFARRSCKVAVTGDGTLTVLRNGEEFAVYTAASTPVELSVPAGGDAFDFTFAFMGEGVANVYGLTAAKGSLFTVR